MAWQNHLEALQVRVEHIVALCPQADSGKRPGGAFGGGLYGIEHHGIVDATNRLVIHYTRDHDAKCIVVEHSLDQFMADHGTLPLRIARASTCTQKAEEVLRRARSREGERGYDVVFCNCEHFANWCFDEESRSEQVQAMTLRATAWIWAQALLLGASADGAAAGGIAAANGAATAGTATAFVAPAGAATAGTATAAGAATAGAAGTATAGIATAGTATAGTATAAGAATAGAAGTATAGAATAGMATAAGATAGTATAGAATASTAAAAAASTATAGIATAGTATAAGATVGLSFALAAVVIGGTCAVWHGHKKDIGWDAFV